MMTRTAALLLGVVLVSVGCARTEPLGPGDGVDSQAPEAPSAPIRTDRSAYTLKTTASAHRLSIGFTFTNPTGSRAYVPTCRTPHPPGLEKWQNGAWVRAYSPLVLQCLDPPLIIEAGATHRGTLDVRAGRAGTKQFPQFQVERIPGTYRLVWTVLGSWTPDGPEPGLGTPLPLQQRVSNSFRIDR